MRDRLIELILNAPKTDVVYGNIKLDKPIQTAQTVADYLLANGVIVPPCKVGDTVYVPHRVWSQDKGRHTKAEPYSVVRITINTQNCWFVLNDGNGLYSFEDLGKIVFLTKEEATMQRKAVRGDG